MRSPAGRSGPGCDEESPDRRVRRPGVSERSCRTLPSAVSRFSAHRPSTWIRAHCRGQKRWCWRAERGMRSSSGYTSELLVERDTAGDGATVDVDFVVIELPGRPGFVPACGPDRSEESGRWRAAERVVVLEDEELLARHLAAGGRAVVLEHVHERRPEKVEVRGIEAGLLGEEGVDKAVAAVQAVGDDLLAAH